MKKFILSFFSLFFIQFAFAANGNKTTLTDKENHSDNLIQQHTIARNYQLFKYEFLNQETMPTGIPSANYRGRTDNTMLYVAGGMAVITTALVVLSANSGDSDGLGDAGTGILIGGGLSTAIITTKFFVDKYR